jgi:hypothetical protein
MLVELLGPDGQGGNEQSIESVMQNRVRFKKEKNTYGRWTKRKPRLLLVSTGATKLRVRTSFTVWV